VNPHPDFWTWFHRGSGACTYVVSDPVTRHAAVIDPVLDLDLLRSRVVFESVDRVLEHLGERQLELDWILETHAHADHLTAAAVLRDRSGGSIGIGSRIVQTQSFFASLFNLDQQFRADRSQFDRLFLDGESFALGRLKITVLATPGHTPDSMTYLIGDAAFVGDTLFRPGGGTARCDFPGSEARALYASIRRLYELPDTTRVFVGHDYPADGRCLDFETTIGAQKMGNIHLRATTSEAEFVALRAARDRTLAPPASWVPALQVNIRAGALPDPEPNGRRYLKFPIELQGHPLRPCPQGAFHEHDEKDSPA